jgi:hypothetical protein
VYQKCKAGDAVVFFYSGHGVWMTNKNLDRDPVKRGMSQAIVMSNLYAAGWDCLVQDETLKDIFNQYVEKKIILTTIFDCCYSANLPMMIGIPKYWEGHFDFEQKTERDIDIYYIPYVPVVNKPPGCPVDANGNIVNLQDSDEDGVPDCKDWEINTLPTSGIDSLGVTIELDIAPDFPTWKFDPHDKFDMREDTSLLIEGPPTRSFNLKDALFATTQSSIRPSDRKDSRFLSLAAAADNMKGLEIRDITGNKHGAFTAALIAVYKTNPSSLQVSVLMKKIREQMNQQSYTQGPGFWFDSSRLKGNLIGTGTAGFMDKVRAKSFLVQKGRITLDKGWYAGIFKGNILTDITAAGKPTIQVIEASTTTAIAIDKSNGKIKEGDLFELTDNYTVSDPILKICILSVPMNNQEFENLFRTKLLPLVNSPNYMDYNFNDDETANKLIVWNDAKRFESFSIDSGWLNPIKDLYCVFPPIPGYIVTPLKTLVQKNQNFTLVQDPVKADLVLYMNYVKKRRGVQSGFVFYFHPPIEPGHASMGEELFSKNSLLLPSLNLTPAAIQSTSRKLYSIAVGYLRNKTNAWLNYYERR